MTMTEEQKKALRNSAILIVLAAIGWKMGKANWMKAAAAGVGGVAAVNAAQTLIAK